MAKPLPRVSAFTRPYWEAARGGRFVLPRCRRCGEHVYYPRPWCPRCWSTALDWVETSGRGRIITYTVVHQAPSQAFADEVPYVLAVARLTEGPQMMANVIRIDPARVRIDMPVRVVFEERQDGFHIPQFAPGEEP